VKKTEIILGGIAILAMFMNTFLVPGGSVLTILSLCLLFLIYLFFSFGLLNDIGFRKIWKKKPYEGISTYKILGTIGTGIGLSSAVIGILFKVMMWPGASMTLESGLTLLGIVFIISYIKNNKTKSQTYLNVIKRSLFIGAIGVIWLFIPRSSFLEFKYRNHPSYVEAMKNVWKNPSNIEFQKTLYEERKKL